jgi:hypothetical protein
MLEAEEKKNESIKTELKSSVEEQDWLKKELD